jgi:stringent starvation protein B
MSARSPEKKLTLLAFLKRGVAMVHLDARHPAVLVPEQFKTDAHLRLNLSYRYGIPDFEVGDDDVAATLSFGGRPFHCVLPWDAVFAVTSSGTGEGQVWPEDLPTEAARGFVQQQPHPRPRPQLAAVDDDEDDDVPAPQRVQEHQAPQRVQEQQAPQRAQRSPEQPHEPPDGPKRGSHLRLVR